ncbi:g2992 [Coccomyxa elongata]
MATQEPQEAETSYAPTEVLPLNRIKRIMKEEADVKAVAADASYAAARATEYLIEEMAARAFQFTLADNRDTISYGDVAKSVSQWAATEFLRDIVPQRIPLSEIIKRLRTSNADAAAAVNGDGKVEDMHTPNGDAMQS